MNIILLGAPASGKGTQSSKICSEFCLAHISSGDLLRENIAKKTKLGNCCEEYIKKGQLVPDEVIIGLIKQKLTEINSGVVFDGFPRNLLQAKELAKIVDIDAVILLDVNEKSLFERIASRKICANCNKIFNTNFYKNSTCDVCGGPLIQRDDDNEKTLKERLNTFYKSTEDMIKYYQSQNILYKIMATSVEDTYKEIKEILEAKLD